MKDFFEFLSIEQGPVVILVGVLILYAMRDLGAKLKKIDHIDILVTQVKSLVDKVQDLISSQDKQRYEMDGEIRAIQIDLKQLHDRVLRLETKQGDSNGR